MSGLIKCFNIKCRDFSRSEVDNCSRPLTRILECPEAVVRTDKSRSGNFYFNDILSNECACGAYKKPQRSFCYKCFKSLPVEMQKALYKHMGEGYEEARDEAGRWLEENVW